jgi:hypothetical protein
VVNPTSQRQLRPPTKRSGHEKRPAPGSPRAKRHRNTVPPDSEHEGRTVTIPLLSFIGADGGGLGVRPRRGKLDRLRERLSAETRRVHRDPSEPSVALSARHIADPPLRGRDIAEVRQVCCYRVGQGNAE